jgi:hypothetical protein
VSLKSAVEERAQGLRQPGEPGQEVGRALQSSRLLSNQLGSPRTNRWSRVRLHDLLEM